MGDCLLCECHMHLVATKWLNILNWDDAYVNVACAFSSCCEVDWIFSEMGDCLCKCYVHLLSAPDDWLFSEERLFMWMSHAFTSYSSS
jgi:hypothetical protein